MIENLNVNLSLTLNKNERVEPHTRIMGQVSESYIALKFWIKSGVNHLYVDWTHTH